MPGVDPARSPVSRGVERALLCGDDELVLLGLTVGLRRLGGLDVVGATTVREAAAAVLQLRPTVVVLDVATMDDPTLSVLRQVTASWPTVVLTHDADPVTARRAAQAGCRAHLVHGDLSVDDVCRSVVDAASGRAARGRARPDHRRRGRGLDGDPAGSAPAVPLSPRERDVMDAMARGWSNREIAAALSVTEKTVKNYINRIFPKLAVRTRAEAIVAWLELAVGDRGRHGANAA